MEKKKKRGMGVRCESSLPLGSVSTLFYGEEDGGLSGEMGGVGWGWGDKTCFIISSSWSIIRINVHLVQNKAAHPLDKSRR